MELATMRTQYLRQGFTLIELLVVIAILAILVSVLLPALSGARKEARAVGCASNIRGVALGVQIYSGDYQYFPPAYVYGEDRDSGYWRIEDQQLSNPSGINGYVHWSYALLSDGDNGVPEGSFRCPDVTNGGAPRTNPGMDIADWEPNQVNDLGQSAPGSAYPLDRQAKRMAYTGNAAVFPRNKFLLAGPRRNQLVKEARIQLPMRTILATEFLETAGWDAIMENQVSKSHRPITPFIGGSAGTDVYSEPSIGNSNTARFFYPEENEILREVELGPGMIADGLSVLNAVGRHHPGAKDKAYGGTANFVFIDGHVERTTVLESIRKRLWGDQFYSLTGRGTKVDLDGF
jgi:prepilin-type N-terminal cleavage/methylation domain-containing protein/prepilin-type processing-associated H-X9-DG protein